MSSVFRPIDRSEHELLVVDDDPVSRYTSVRLLQSAGFEPHWLMNHDGRFGDFFADVHDRGVLPATPTPAAGASVAQYSFDGSPIYGDYSALSRWWRWVTSSSSTSSRDRACFTSRWWVSVSASLCCGIA